MFRRKSTDASPMDLPDDLTPGKGRPTPTRKEAEAARKAALTAPVDPKAAKKASRNAQRTAQYQAQAALRSGDERYLPARDAGPVRAYVREAVDSRLSMGELFIPVAVAVILLGFVRVPLVQQLLLLAWLFMLIGVVVDSLFIVWRLRKTLPALFPDEDRSGAQFYGVMRSLQIRRFRLPKPKVRYNGQPVVPKAPKAPKTPNSSTKA